MFTFKPVLNKRRVMIPNYIGGLTRRSRFSLLTPYNANATGLARNKLPHTSSTNKLVTRQLNLFSVFGRAAKGSAYVGGTFAAGGSYVAYKLEQALHFTQDKFAAFTDFTDGVFDKTGKFFKDLDFGSSPDGDSSSHPAGGDNGGGDSAAAVGATAAAVSLASDDEDENNTNYDDDDEYDEETLIDDDEDVDEEVEEDETTDEMMTLTRQMIDIRNLLASINHDGIKLPSIVVVGSQSSGKSSVLESIAGQEFLPKGSNMVTRRPIELTLINTPDSAADVAEFPALRMSNITDFQQVQKVLFDLNMAVPAHECVSDDPIQITIRSRRVPDLSLVDLPGYIQVEAADQPIELKQRIRNLCNRYLEAPNIILAISAADVDLANSAALRASRLADPKGERTIGVVTKLDLVSPEQARKVLTNRKYPLRMGYVGVITKAPPAAASKSGIFGRKQQSSYQSFVAQQNFEHTYLKVNREEFKGTTTGTRNLKRKLMKVLEKTMASSLRPTYMAIQQELEETSYQFKVEFNDRQLTPQMYLANNIDALKLATKELSKHLARRELKSLLKNELDQRTLDLLAERYWNKPFTLKGSQLSSPEPHLAELSQISNIDNDVYWHKKLDLTTSSLTKSGMGRLSTTLITNALITEVANMVDITQLRNHPKARAAVIDAAKTVLAAKFYATADQVENSIKPYKYEIELEDRDWESSRANTSMLLKEEMRQCDEVYSDLKRQIGGRKLTQVMAYLSKLKQQATIDIDLTSNEALGFSPALIEHGKAAIFLKDRLALLKMRQLFISGSKKCKRKENKYQCPEIFLDAVGSKMLATSVLFLNVELLSDFYYNFPRELDEKFFKALSIEEIDAFAKEDPKIEKHIRLQERKDMLEIAVKRIESVLATQGGKISLLSERSGSDNQRQGIFGWAA